MNHLLTPARIIRWSTLVLVGVFVITLTTFFSLRQITAETDRITQELARRQTDQRSANRAATRIQQHGSTATVLAPFLPDETSQPQFYQMLESLASRNNVSIHYNAGQLSEQDPTILEAIAAPDRWVVPVDFLGERAAVERVFQTIEMGPYILRVHAYRFDISDPAATQLSTLLILYGRPTP